MQTDCDYRGLRSFLNQDSFFMCFGGLFCTRLQFDNKVSKRSVSEFGATVRVQ